MVIEPGVYEAAIEVTAHANLMVTCTAPCTPMLIPDMAMAERHYLRFEPGEARVVVLGFTEDLSGVFAFYRVVVAGKN